MSGYSPITELGEEPHRLDGKLEPEAKDCASLTEASLLSIAVSMKRLADHLAGTDLRSGLVDAIYDVRTPQ